MNQGKSGQPFRYPHSLAGGLQPPLPSTGGVCQGIGEADLHPILAPDYSTLSLRIPNLNLDPALGYEPWEEEVVIAVDGIGIKVTNRGEWMRKERKGYIEIHVGVDTKTKQVVSLEVSDERIDDGEKLEPLVRKARGKTKVQRVLEGSGYDTHDNFKFLAASGIEARPGSRVREDSDPNCGGAREEVVRAYLKDPPGWEERVGYGRRWMAETFFSRFKRLFGEVVSAKKFAWMVKGIELKVWVYNLMLGLSAAPSPALSAVEG